MVVEIVTKKARRGRLRLRVETSRNASNFVSHTLTFPHVHAS